MRRALPATLGALAIVALIFAQRAVFATIPVAGALRLGATSWGGNGRLWVAVALIAVALALRLCGRKTVASALLAGAAGGILADIAISGWEWRAENLALLESLGATAIARGIRWGPGLGWFVAAGGFVLAFAATHFYSPTPKVKQERIPT